MLINNVWETIFEFKKKNYLSPIINRPITSLIIIDNFYKYPDMVREFALKQEFIEDRGNKGRRSEECFRFEGIKEAFEFNLNKKIINWSIYETNGCFQLCMTSEQLVYFYDLQEYAAIICLTPDSQLETELVDKIGNVYNRLVIFDAKLIRSASCYFGNNDNNCRLFQMFFFDLEN
jgi:hypothetical protein